jgi:hypothetical protein
MSSTLKTMLIAGTIAAAVALFAMQAANAGGRHGIPYMPFNSYVQDTYDEDVEYYGSRRGYGDDDAYDEPVTVRGIARKAMNGEIEDIIDYIAE